jgi:hypothetical protein
MQYDIAAASPVNSKEEKQINGIHIVIHTEKGTGHGKRPDCCHFTQLKDQTTFIINKL